tara:strand:+ start:738 stop:1208 length:471 start_codon:yes stop_codon:yes gene_type:complete
MKKTIKTIAALLIIGTAFTACTKEEATPATQVSIEDFETKYRFKDSPEGSYFLFQKRNDNIHSPGELFMDSLFNGDSTRRALMHRYGAAGSWYQTTHYIVNLLRTSNNTFSGYYGGNNALDRYFEGEVVLSKGPDGRCRIAVTDSYGSRYIAVEVK